MRLVASVKPTARGADDQRASPKEPSSVKGVDARTGRNGPGTFTARAWCGVPSTAMHSTSAAMRACMNPRLDEDPTKSPQVYLFEKNETLKAPGEGPGPAQESRIVDVHLRSIDGPVAFDRYVLDPVERRLSRDGDPLVLPARAFELLTTLIAHRGEALSREELYDLLWPGGSVEDANLSQNIYLLRRALDPGGDGRRFIQTLPRHGYRFAVPVRRIRTHGEARALLRLRAIHVAVAACLCALTLLLAGSAVRSMDVPLPHSAGVSYALGVYHWNMRTPAQVERSLGYFASTVREAPQSALGYAGLADAYAIQADNTDDRSRLQKQYLRLAERYRDAALARDPNSAEAHTVSAFLDERFYGNVPLAEREFRVALTTNPNYATAHHWHAIVRFAGGDIQGAVREWELAHQTRADLGSDFTLAWDRILLRAPLRERGLNALGNARPSAQ